MTIFIILLSVSAFILWTVFSIYGILFFKSKLPKKILPKKDERNYDELMERYLQVQKNYDELALQLVDDENN